MLKIIKTVLISTTFIFFLGCGGPKMAVISKDRIQQVKSAKVASNYHMVTRRINYLETLFRGLWLETKTSSLDLGSIWNPDVELNPVIAKKLEQNLQLNTALLKEFNISSTEIEAYHQVLNSDYTKNNSGEHPEIPGTLLGPKAEYFDKYPAFPEFEVIRNKLLEQNVEYYFEFLATDVYGNAPGYGMVIVNMPSQMRLIDLRTKEVIWKDLFATHEVYQLGGDLKKLEEDNLKILKEGINLGLDKLMSTERLGPSFGIEVKKKKS